MGINFNKHCRYKFGEYVQMHEELDNTMVPRTIGALALRPMGNIQGSFYFFSLSTGRVIARNRATSLPMPEDIIDQVHRIARRQKANLGMVFADCDQMVDKQDDSSDSDDNNYNDNDSDDESAGVDDLANSGFNNIDQIAGVNDDGVDPGIDDKGPPNEHEGPPNDPEEMEQDDNPEEMRQDVHHEEEIAGVEAIMEELDKSEDQGADEAVENQEARVAEAGDGRVPAVKQDDPGALDQVEADMDARYGRRSGRYSLRTRRPRNYSHLFAAKFDDDQYPIQQASLQENDHHGTLMGTYAKNNLTLEITRMGAKRGTELGTLVTNSCTERETRDIWSQKPGASDENGPQDDVILETPQMNMRQGIKMFGAVQAVKNEMQQLHDRKVMAARHPKELTQGQKKEALAYLMFLKRKRCEKKDGDVLMGESSKPTPQRRMQHCQQWPQRPCP